MVSARAQEYITRFTTKGMQKKTVMKKIVEYRDECKSLYHEADAKQVRNYPAEVAKKEYLSDMIKRIECLAEARDYLQEQVNTAAVKKAPAMSAVRYSPPEETTTRSYAPPRPTKESYYSSSPESAGSYRAPTRPSKQNKKAAKEAKRAEVRAYREAEARKLFQKTGESKYVLRFQSLGLKDLDVFKCSEAAQKYMEVWEAERERNPDDEDYQERADEAISDLQEAIEYFEDTLSTEVCNALSPSTYNAGNDEYVYENSLGGYGSSDNEDIDGNRYD